MALNATYHVLENTCGGCTGTRSTNCIHAAVKCAHAAAAVGCWASVVSMRVGFVASGCETLLPAKEITQAK